MTKHPIIKEFSSIMRPIIIVSILLNVVTIPVGLVQARLISDVIMAATAGNYQMVIYKSVLLISIIIVINLFLFLTRTAYQRHRLNTIHKCKLLLYRRFFLSPLSILYQSSAGEAKVVLNNDFNKIVKRIADDSPQTVSAIITVIVYFAFLSIKSPLIGCILIIVSLVQIIPPLVFTRLYKKYDSVDKKYEAESTDLVLELYNGFSTIKVFRLKDLMINRLKCLHDKWCGVANRLQAVSRSEEAIKELISNVLTYGTYAIVGLFILGGLIRIEVGIQAITLSAGLFAAVKTCFSAVMNYGIARVSEKRMMVFWHSQNTDKRIIPQYTNMDIEFSEVSCALNEKQIYSNLNTDLSMNETILIRGENGCGKSTLIKLALGMIESQKGNIHIGNIDSSCLSYDNFPRNILYLPQEDVLYNITPSELYGILLNDEEVKTAYSIGLQLGIENEVFERLIPDLSGGERKKVFISLAFSIKPIILILDEPTNSLDERGCQVLYDLLKDRSGGTIVISHDKTLSSIATVVYRVQEGGITLERKR